MRTINTVAILILFCTFFLLVILRVPVAFALAIPALLTILYVDRPVSLLVEQMYSSLEYFPLLAIPFFILAGFLMNYGDITDRFLRIAEVMVGHFKGGLAQVNIVVSMMFGGVSGTATADTAGIGSMLIPAMVKRGYSPGFSAAVTACSSTMGVIIPPSVLMIVYGSLSNTSISSLFLAGIIPGILVGVSQMGISYGIAKKRDYPSEQRATLPEVGTAFKRGFLPLGVPAIIIGGIIFGIFTATEAGVIAVVYSLVLILAYRSIKLRDLPRIMQEATQLVALPVFAIAAAVVFSWLVAYLKVPDFIGNILSQYSLSPFMTLICVFLIFLIIGMFLDGVPALIIFLPVAQEISEVVGIDPIHMGMVIIVTLSLGLVTPPFGLCLLLAGSIAKISVPETLKETAIFFPGFLLIILLLILFPQLVLFIPNMFG